MSSRHFFYYYIHLTLSEGVVITGPERACCQEAKSVTKQEAYLDAKAIQCPESVHHWATGSLVDCQAV